MANYVEYIQAGTGEAWPIRDKETSARLDEIDTLKLIEEEKEMARADYVVEQGELDSSSGTWTYRKWNSGICEAWANFDNIEIKGVTTINGLYAGWGSVYYPPDLFSTIETVNYTSYCTSGYDWSGKLVLEGITHFNFYIVSTSSITTSSLVRIYPHVIGTWE